MEKLFKVNGHNAMIDLFKPKYRKTEILKHISQCMDVGWTNQGYKTIEFENEFKNYTGFQNPVFMSSATSGLDMAIKILKQQNFWKSGDEIITTPLTFVSTNHAIVSNKMDPVFCDVDDNLCLDLNSIKRNITKKTKAVMFVGIGGNIGQYYDILKFCNENNLKMILDAAHMMGTTVHGKQVGVESDACIFSFHTVKNLPTADSGMLCFKCEENSNLAKKLSWMGINKNTYDRVIKTSYNWEYNVIDFGNKSHSNSIMASFGLVGLKYLKRDNEKRRYICDLYEDKLKDISIKHNSLCESSRHLYQISVKNRNLLFDKLSKCGIQSGVHYKNNTEYDIYKKYKQDCKNAKRLSDSILSLPLNLFLTKSNILFITKQILNNI